MSKRRKRQRQPSETPTQLARRLTTERITIGNALDRKSIVQADGPAAWAKQLERTARKPA